MSKLIGAALPNIPWQDCPPGCREPVWRYSGNPIIQRDAIPTSNSIFNSAVAPFRGGFAGIFRCDSRAVEMNIHAGFSEDGLRWRISPQAIRFQGGGEAARYEYRYDPRVCRLEGRYYITWCNGYHGPTIGLGYTEDFQAFHQLENTFLPYNRNGVLFPRKIGGRYAMLSRPSDGGHTPFGDIFYSESSDLTYWGRHRFVMGTVPGNASAWQSLKVGPGPVPIETDLGWLLLYHGVINTCNGFVYRVGGALLDRDEPWKVLARSRFYLLGPQEPYECVGDVPNVTFPCAALTDAGTGRIAIYYGCADTVTGLAFTTVDRLVNYIQENNLLF